MRQRKTHKCNILKISPWLLVSVAFTIGCKSQFQAMPNSVGVAVSQSSSSPTPSPTPAPSPAPAPDPTPAPSPAPYSGQTIVSQVHNAPGWMPNTNYTATNVAPYTRVNSGPGWNPVTQQWVPGQTLAAYQLTSSGTCKSGTIEPTGSGSSIQDGTCMWKYLSDTDYISITGWSYDNQSWKSGTNYVYSDVVTSDSPLRAYMLLNTTGCTSTVAPTGAGTTYEGVGDGNLVATSDGCTWVHIADILYSSEKSYIPTQVWTNGGSGPSNIMMQANYEAMLWNDREYIAGQNGEKSPISIRNHDSYTGEGETLVCPKGGCPHVIVTTAPGESFADNLKPTDALSGIDPSKGVTILDNDGYRWPVEPDGLYIENYVDLIGLQIDSAHSAAVGSFSAGYDNDVTVRDCICEGGPPVQWADNNVISADTGSVVANSLIIANGPVGIDFKYPGVAIHDTIVNPNHYADSVGITTWHNWVFAGQYVSNDAIFGFAHAAASSVPEDETSWNGSDVDWIASNNATDALSTDSATGTPGGTVDWLPNTAYGISASAAFVSFGTDWRVKSGGPLYGKGSAFGTFPIYCETQPGSPACPFSYNFDGLDIINTARPQNGSYDIGAWQSP